MLGEHLNVEEPKEYIRQHPPQKKRKRKKKVYTFDELMKLLAKLFCKKFSKEILSLDFICKTISCYFPAHHSLKELNHLL